MCIITARREKGGSADPCTGRSRGSLTTKIHALVDAEERPLRLELTAGQAGDAPVATRLLDTLAPGATVIADKAYDTDAIRSFVAAPRSIGSGNKRLTVACDLQSLYRGA